MAATNFQPIQGMSDIAPPEIYLWQALEEQAREVFGLYGFEEVRTPCLEKTDLFHRSIGDATDIVEKEMYTFEDRGGRSLTLRPEGTASIVRYVAGGGAQALDSRLFYWAPMFRCERPQAGRKRQFHQVGAEAFGAPNPASDAEAIALQVHLLEEWGLKGAQVKINTRGVQEDREAVSVGLKKAIQPHVDQLCDVCKTRSERNVLRIMDCKNAGCQKIVDALPPTTSFMSEASTDYLAQVQHYLKILEVDTTLDPRLVRGLDYYVHTVWEITHGSLGAQDALSGGGRYQIALGGKVIEGVGFAMGVERVITALTKGELDPASLQERLTCWIISQSERAHEENFTLLQTLRKRGVSCGLDLKGRSFKAQLRAANRAGATRVIIRGDHELDSGTFQMKNFEDGTQEEIGREALMKQLIVDR